MKKFLPKVWMKQIFFKGNNKKYAYKSCLEFCVRFGAWMSSDEVSVIKEKIYVLPCLFFHYNHSEVYVMFAWFNFFCYVFYKDYEREVHYRQESFGIR